MTKGGSAKAEPLVFVRNVPRLCSFPYEGKAITKASLGGSSARHSRYVMRENP